MQSSKDHCQRCKGCCKFAEDETYFAPIFTKEEKEKVDANFKKYKSIYQIELKKQGNIYVCPLLDNDHLCTIYNMRPFDCKIWPFIFMKDQNNNLVLACFDKDLCPHVEDMSEEEFNQLKNNTLDWIEENNIINFIKKNKDLIWPYEEDTFIIKEIV
ncbi:MAG: YkgJ family cysteine cluster protein [Nanoarchaeota archaeon]|nr:YkgJ family cysteine cluster protein [Nanoarchaeota archaeon]